MLGEDGEKQLTSKDWLTLVSEWGIFIYLFIFPWGNKVLRKDKKDVLSHADITRRQMAVPDRHKSYGFG